MNGLGTRYDHRRVTGLGLGLALTLLFSCSLAGPETVSEVGTVEFLELEGGCWAIQTEEERYEPRNLSEEFRQDGLRVRFQGEVRSDMASICQIGPIIEVQEIERTGE